MWWKFDIIVQCLIVQDGMSSPSEQGPSDQTQTNDVCGVTQGWFVDDLILLMLMIRSFWYMRYSSFLMFELLHFLYHGLYIFDVRSELCLRVMKMMEWKEMWLMKYDEMKGWR